MKLDLTVLSVQAPRLLVNSSLVTSNLPESLIGGLASLRHYRICLTGFSFECQIPSDDKGLKGLHRVVVKQGSVMLEEIRLWVTVNVDLPPCLPKNSGK
jgi:hypothetical protein